MFSTIQISNVWHPCPRLVKYDIFTCSSLCHLNFPTLPLLPQCDSLLYEWPDDQVKDSIYVVQFGKKVSVENLDNLEENFEKNLENFEENFENLDNFED